MQKKGESFYNLDSSKCLIVYNVVLANANKHFEVARILKINNEHASAISHLILGSEELIKGILLLLEGKSFNLRRHKEIQLLFRNHIARHNLLRDTYSVWLAFKSFIEMFKKLSSPQKNKISSTLYKVFKDLTFAKRSHEWWMKADELKQKALYVDYRDGLIMPFQLSEVEHSEADLHIRKLRQEIELFRDWFESLSTEKLKEFRASFFEAKFDKLFIEAIKKNNH